jgi:hypothetical protein
MRPQSPPGIATTLVGTSLLGRCRVSVDFLQLLKAILAPSIDFGLLNPLAVRGLDVQGKLAPPK